ILQRSDALVAHHLSHEPCSDACKITLRQAKRPRSRRSKKSEGFFQEPFATESPPLLQGTQTPESEEHGYVHAHRCGASRDDEPGKHLVQVAAKHDQRNAVVWNLPLKFFLRALHCGKSRLQLRNPFLQAVSLRPRRGSRHRCLIFFRVGFQNTSSHGGPFLSPRRLAATSSSLRKPLPGDSRSGNQWQFCRAPNEAGAQERRLY